MERDDEMRACHTWGARFRNRQPDAEADKTQQLSPAAYTKRFSHRGAGETREMNSQSTNKQRIRGDMNQGKQPALFSTK